MYVDQVASSHLIFFSNFLNICTPRSLFKKWIWLRNTNYSTASTPIFSFLTELLKKKNSYRLPRCTEYWRRMKTTNPTTRTGFLGIHNFFKLPISLRSLNQSNYHNLQMPIRGCSMNLHLRAKMQKQAKITSFPPKIQVQCCTNISADLPEDTLFWNESEKLTR